MEIFKQLNKLGYKHYVDLTIEELDKLPIDSIERRIECSLIIDWFREKHKIRVCNLVNIYIEATFIIYHSTDVEVIDGNDFYKTREQAILKAIELCKKQ